MSATTETVVDKSTATTDARKATVVLTMNTVSFAVCFACWVMNGVLITHLATSGVFDWTTSQIGILMATPILTGSILRLPVGLLTDKYGGRTVYTLLMLIAAAALVLNSFANSYIGFVISALGFGLAGASFAVGVAYTSIWFDKSRQGTALGIFGTGNAGTALTLLFAPVLLQWLTNNGSDPNGWRKLPLIYAGVLAVTAILFWLLTYTRKPAVSAKSLGDRLRPLGEVRVWRFGMYYFLVFGGFVALSNWLLPYYVKAYGLTLATAGLFVTIYSLPSGLFRAVGGWLSDKFGARRVMYWVLSTVIACLALLLLPAMDIITPGEGIQAKAPGKITSLEGNKLVVQQPNGKQATYTLAGSPPAGPSITESRELMLLPRTQSWQTWASISNADGTGTRALQVGDSIERRQLLARGFTQISFQANVYVFTLIVLVMGIAMGIGMAAVYKHIPTYFPNDVGVVGGLVGVIGGLGGFFCPIIFGSLIQRTGVWTSCWAFLLLFAIGCFAWMHVTIQRMMRREVPQLMKRFEQPADTGQQA